MEHYSRVHAAIHMDAVLDNMEKMRANIKEDTQMIAVVKTDGYGHGAEEIARQTEGLPCGAMRWPQQKKLFFFEKRASTNPF